MRRVEAEDVGRGREDHGRDHDVRPVRGERGVEIRAEPNEDAGESGYVKEDRIEREMEGDMQPVLPKDTIGTHGGRIWGGFVDRDPLLQAVPGRCLAAERGFVRQT